MGLVEDEASYCNSKNKPALDAVGVVTDLVVVRVSKANVANEILVDSGVDEKESSDERRWERTVVLPVPDSPLSIPISTRPFNVVATIERAHKNTTA